jgi:hypothetical protein
VTHPAIDALLRWFESDHLPPHLQAVVQPYRQLALNLAAVLHPSPELTVALRKLLESKDAAVRAAIITKENGQ